MMRLLQRIILTYYGIAGLLGYWIRGYYAVCLLRIVYRRADKQLIGPGLHGPYRNDTYLARPSDCLPLSLSLSDFFSSPLLSSSSSLFFLPFFLSLFPSHRRSSQFSRSLPPSSLSPVNAFPSMSY